MSDNKSQEIKDWRNQQIQELKNNSLDINGKNYVSFGLAKRLLGASFTKGFKTARRDRHLLSDHLIEEMKKHFTIKRNTQ